MASEARDLKQAVDAPRTNFLRRTREIPACRAPTPRYEPVSLEALAAVVANDADRHLPEPAPSRRCGDERTG